MRVVLDRHVETPVLEIEHRQYARLGAEMERINAAKQVGVDVRQRHANLDPRNAGSLRKLTNGADPGVVNHIRHLAIDLKSALGVALRHLDLVAKEVGRLLALDKTGFEQQMRGGAFHRRLAGHVHVLCNRVRACGAVHPAMRR